MKNIEIKFDNISNIIIRDKIKTFFVNLEVNQPNLFVVIDELAKQATQDGSIILNFSAHAYKYYPLAIWKFTTREIAINIDLEVNYLKIIESFIFELCNACNKALHAILVNANSFAKEQDYAVAHEIAEYKTSERASAIMFDYLKNNKVESLSLLANYELSYDLELSKARDKQALTLQDYFVNFKPGDNHFDFYCKNWRENQNYKQQLIDLQNKITEYFRQAYCYESLDQNIIKITCEEKNIIGLTKDQYF